MRRLLATLTLSLALAGCSERNTGPETGPATGAQPAVAQVQLADLIDKGCYDYATALQVVTPLKSSIASKAVAIIEKANAVTALACLFGSAGGHYAAAVAGWAAAKGAV